MYQPMQQRRDLAANWTAGNPVLLPGEIGLETDTYRFKIGDGVTAWNTLIYWLNPTPKSGAATTGALAETCQRIIASGSSTPTSGVLNLMSTTLTAGQTIGHIGFCTGSTPTTAASHWWVALLDTNFVQQAHSLDQTVTNLAASTWYKLAMAQNYTATYTGTYYLGIMIAVTSGNVATIVSPTFSPASQFVTGSGAPLPVVGGTSTGSLTTPGTDGTTAYLAPTAAGPTYYMYASA